jgi:hypothetical protein
MDSPFYSRYNAQIFFGLTGINAFMNLCMCFFLVQKLCLSTTHLPASGKELKNQLLTDCIVCNHDKSYLSGIFSAQICETQFYFLLLENNWEYLYNCACQAFPRLVREFYGHMIVIQDGDRGLIMQTMVRGQTILINPQLINSVIEVPVLPVSGVPFPDEAPSIEFLHDFFGTRSQRENKSHPQINIGAFAPMHRFLAKVVVTNLWPQARRSELTLKKATLLYAIVMQTPFCLCKHILHIVLEVRDEKNTSLSFRCLITQICLQVVPNISDSEPRSRIPDPLGIQTLKKSNA